MLLLERDYQIPGAQKKKAYLIEKNMPAEGMQKIIQQATKERSEGHGHQHRRDEEEQEIPERAACQRGLH